MVSRRYHTRFYRCQASNPTAGRSDICVGKLSGHQWPLKPWQPIVLALPALPTASIIATTTPTDLLLLALSCPFFCQGSVRKVRKHMMRLSRSARTRRVLRPLADNGWLSSKEDSDALAIQWWLEGNGGPFSGTVIQLSQRCWGWMPRMKHTSRHGLTSCLFVRIAVDRQEWNMLNSCVKHAIAESFAVCCFCPAVFVLLHFYPLSQATGETMWRRQHWMIWWSRCKALVPRLVR